MLLNQLIDSFKAEYKIECQKRGTPEIALASNYIRLMFGKTVGRVQRMLGIINSSCTIDLILDRNPDYKAGMFDLPADFQQEINVLSDIPLIKKPLSWIQSQAAVAGDPLYYAISASGNIQQITFYPVPSVVSCVVTINYRLNFAIYNQDAFQNGAGSNDALLPDEYDQALLTGMLSQMFPDMKTDFEQEIHLLRTTKKNALSFNTYDMR